MSELKLNINLEKIAQEVATKVLDEYSYHGKTIREWADGLTNPACRGDRLRTLSDEDLAAFLADHPLVTEFDPENPRHASWLAWLQEEIETEEMCHEEEPRTP